MKEIILILLGVIIATIAVIMIFDARVIATTRFSSSKVNETTRTLKIVGFIVLLIGVGFIYIVKSH